MMRLIGWTFFLGCPAKVCSHVSDVFLSYRVTLVSRHVKSDGPSCTSCLLNPGSILLSTHDDEPNKCISQLAFFIFLFFLSLSLLPSIIMKLSRRYPSLINDGTVRPPPDSSFLFTKQIALLVVWSTFTCKLYWTFQSLLSPAWWTTTSHYIWWKYHVCNKYTTYFWFHLPSFDALLFIKSCISHLRRPSHCFCWFGWFGDARRLPIVFHHSFSAR